jgi:IS5 family transposase
MAAFDGLAVAVRATRHKPATLVQVSSRGAMDWNDVRVFLAVAREGSMRAAGRALGLSQPTIARRLAAFEASPPSTKNKSKSRDPEMHQAKKGNQWHFGMKAHIGVDVASGVVHTLTGTAANEADINQTAALLHGREEAVFADAGYTGADKRPELEDCDVSWNIAVKRSIIKALPKALRDWAEAVESALSQVRAWVEHPFHIVKNLFRHKKLRYRGLAKNTAQLHTLFALANLVIVKKTLLAQGRP